ncbi:MAG: Hpt domain-containing protein [Fibrobacterales bacterium]
MSLEPVLPESIRVHLADVYGLPEENIDMMLEATKKSITENLELAEKSLLEKNSETFVRVSHSMKGALLNLGQEGWAEVASQMEKLGSESITENSLSGLLKDLQQGLSNLV